MSFIDLQFQENARILSTPFVMQMFGLGPMNQLSDDDNENDGDKGKREMDEENSSTEDSGMEEVGGEENEQEDRFGGEEPTLEDQEKVYKAGQIGGELEDSLYQISRGFKRYGRIFEEDYWRQVVGEGSGLSVCEKPLSVNQWKKFKDNTKPQTKKNMIGEEVKLNLVEDGYFSYETPLDEKGEKSFEKLTKMVRKLKEMGWPPVFIYVFDEAWEVYSRIWTDMEELLGGECVLEPSMFCYCLESNPKPIKGGTYLGGNFGLPHRDHNARESIDENGHPMILSIWVPLNDATIDNGCMYVIPKEFDAHFDKPENDVHMKSATWAKDGTVSIRFDLSAGRPLPAKAGTTLGWYGNLIHWGSKCRKYHKDPRISITCTFRRQDFAPTHLQGYLESLTKKDFLDLPLYLRIQFIAKSLLLYKWWYPLPDHAVPKEFYD